MKVKPPRDKLSFSPEGNKKTKGQKKKKFWQTKKRSLLTEHKLLFLPNSFFFGNIFGITLFLLYYFFEKSNVQNLKKGLTYFKSCFKSVPIVELAYFINLVL